MRRERTLAVRVASAGVTVVSGALVFGVGGGFGCTAYSTLKDVPADCTVENGDVYQYLATDDSEPKVRPNGNWWGSGDSDPPDGSSSNAFSTAELIPDGPHCGSKTSDVLHSSGYYDWGSLFGYNNFGATRNGAGYEGISFWAHASVGTTNGFTLLLDDDNTAADDSSTTVKSSKCRDYGVGDAGTPNVPTGPSGTTDPSTGTPIVGSSSTRASYPDECGNNYTVAMQVTSDWVFYRIPFRAFQQAATPNRVPNGALAADPGDLDAGTTVLTARLRRFGVRAPREAILELWIDKVAFYRKGSADAGIAAGQM
jgi:hypothetical protein